MSIAIAGDFGMEDAVDQVARDAATAALHHSELNRAAHEGHVRECALARTEAREWRCKADKAFNNIYFGVMTVLLGVVGSVILELWRMR